MSWGLLRARSGDGLDQSFAPNGTYGFFLGYHESAKDTSSYHTARSDTYDLFIEPVLGPLPTGGDSQGLLIYYIMGGVAVVAARALQVYPGTLEYELSLLQTIVDMASQ